MKINKMKSINHLSTDYTLIGFTLLLLTSFLVLPLNVKSAAVDIDTSGDGKAAAFDGEEGIATEGDSFVALQTILQEASFLRYLKGL